MSEVAVRGGEAGLDAARGLLATEAVRNGYDKWLCHVSHIGIWAGELKARR
jgi:hypothetical protein